MRKLALLVLFVMGLNACTTLNLGDGSLLYRHNQEKRLAEAVALQNQGKISSAMESYLAISSGRGLPGVTDEALFRLTLLYLGIGENKDNDFVPLAQQNLERLKKEYPTSSWTAMAAPVAELLASSAELRRQILNTKGQNQALTKENQALTKENQDLKESIEKLKRLDLELEKKRK